MAKPWARYEVGYVNHPKFRALPANAIMLWVEGKDYADAHLTDGLLTTNAVKHFRFFSQRNVKLLLTSIGPKGADGQELYAPLWEPHPVGYKMHDYLDHNECREEALARIAVGQGTATEDQKRIAATARQRKKRQREKDSPVTPASVTLRDRPRDTSVTERDMSRFSVTQQKTEDRSQIPSSKAGRGPLPPDARSKRPIFTGQKLTVFEWMFDELDKLLAPHTDAFDLHEWFFTLDETCVKHGIVPPRDNCAWLKAETLAEAQRRGLPLKVASVEDVNRPTGPSKRPYEVAK